jgi:hypothetical protein
MIGAPRREWARVAADPTGIGALDISYVAILAGFAVTIEAAHQWSPPTPAAAALEIAGFGYVAALFGVAVLGVVSSKLAPLFGGVDDLHRGIKLAAFSHTPVWLAAPLLLVPRIGPTLALAGTLYGVYVYYLGIGDLLCVPPRGRLVCTALAIAATIAVAATMGALALMLAGDFQLVRVPDR